MLTDFLICALLGYRDTKAAAAAVTRPRDVRQAWKPRMVALQVLELPNKTEKVVDFAWEPRGSRFAMLHGDGPRPSFSLYGMKDMKTSAKGVQHIGTQTGKQANSIHWSPQVGLLFCRPGFHQASCYVLAGVYF